MTSPAVVPSRLSYFAIYNPTLSHSEDTLIDQVAFYASRTPSTTDEQLRRVGLVQGINSFGRAFSGSHNVSTIRTVRSTVLLTEVEPDWWILACIDHAESFKVTNKSSSQASDQSVSYDDRDLPSSQVLTAQLNRAYQVFKLLHGTLSNLLESENREGLKRMLDHWWGNWVWKWDIGYVGHAAMSLWNGILVDQETQHKDTLSELRLMTDRLQDEYPDIIGTVVARRSPPHDTESSRTYLSAHSDQLSPADVRDLVQYLEYLHLDVAEHQLSSCSDSANSENGHSNTNKKSHKADSSWSLSSLSLPTLPWGKPSATHAPGVVSSDTSQTNADVPNKRWLIGLTGDESPLSTSLPKTTSQNLFIGSDSQMDGAAEGSEVSPRQVRVIVYMTGLLIFLILVEPTCSHLSSVEFYRRIASELEDFAAVVGQPSTPTDTGSPKSSEFHYLLWNPQTLETKTSIPAIPHTKTEGLSTPSSDWTMEDLTHVHTQMANVISVSQTSADVKVRIIKSSKGFWIVWRRLENGREGVAVRRWIPGDGLEDVAKDAKELIYSTFKEWRP